MLRTYGYPSASSYSVFLTVKYFTCAKLNVIPYRRTYSSKHSSRRRNSTRTNWWCTPTQSRDPNVCPVCIRSPLQGEVSWIRCDSCDQWFHQECLEVSPEAAQAELFYCPPCYQAYQRTQMRSKPKLPKLLQMESKVEALRSTTDKQIRELQTQVQMRIIWAMVSLVSAWVFTWQPPFSLQHVEYIHPALFAHLEFKHCFRSHQRIDWSESYRLSRNNFTSESSVQKRLRKLRPDVPNVL